MWGRAWRGLAAGVAAVANWRFLKPATFVVCAMPLLLVAYELAEVLLWNRPDALGADPAKALLHETGQDALRLLLITLCITPVRRLFQVNRVQTIRRMLGVWSFVYALCHVSIYLTFDQLCYSWQTCQFGDIGRDISRRPFIIAGLVAFTLLSALAATSTGGWVRRLRRNWQRLHRLVYVAAAAGVVHYIWIQKSDISAPLRWADWLAVLLAVRVYYAVRKRRSQRLVSRNPLTNKRLPA